MYPFAGRERPDPHRLTHLERELGVEAVAPRSLRGPVLGVGMGLPGPVHLSGVVGSSAILPGWAGTPAAARMSERLGMEAWLGNDANLGALAEAIWGAGRDTRTLVYLKLSTGIGAGIVIDGRLFGGAGGTAGEFSALLQSQQKFWREALDAAGVRPN